MEIVLARNCPKMRAQCNGNPRPNTVQDLILTLDYGNPMVEETEYDPQAAYLSQWSK